MSTHSDGAAPVGARSPLPHAHHVPSTDGVTLALHDLGGEGPPVLLCHATGFHGPVWGPVAAALGPAARTWAVDLRGHGDSTLPASGSLSWQGMGDDVVAAAAAVVDAAADGDREGRGLVGVGHSMGGAALLLAEQDHPGLFSRLWCYEPIVFPSPDGPPPSNPLAAAARRRKAAFPDREAALANYAAKPPLGALAPEALRAYVDHGFRDVPGGGVELKCAPETEARVFERGSDHGAFARLPEVRCPVTVAVSGDGGYPAQFAPRVAENLPDGTLVRFDGLSHFGPMEDPGAIATALRAVLPPAP